MTSLSKMADGRLQEIRAFCYCYCWAIDDMRLLRWNILLIVDEYKHEPMSCIANSRIEKEAVSLRGCVPAGAKALDDIGFAPVGAVDRS